MRRLTEKDLFLNNQLVIFEEFNIYNYTYSILSNKLVDFEGNVSPPPKNPRHYVVDFLYLISISAIPIGEISLVIF